MGWRLSLRAFVSRRKEKSPNPDEGTTLADEIVENANKMASNLRDLDTRMAQVSEALEDYNGRHST